MREKMFSVGGSDLKWDFFRAGGNGGQKQNKTSSGARVRHAASGAVAECRDERSQLQNRRTALKRLGTSPRFRMWVNERFQEIERGTTIEKEVAKALHPSSLKVEIKLDGEWVETTL